MKNKENILDVDFIGEQDALTYNEELSIKEYFRTKKLKNANKKRKSNITLKVKEKKGHI